MISTPWYWGLFTLLFVLLLVPLVQVLSARFDLYDRPGLLKIHSKPISRLGGITIALALIASIGAVVSRGSNSSAGMFLLVALSLVWLSGLLDDLRGLHPANRIVAQIIAALLLCLGGWEISIFSSAAGNLTATCVFVVFSVNAFNFLDGADGLASGVAALVAISYIAIPGGMQTRLSMTIAWTLLGACLGFLIANFPPANIHLGDSGSTVLGFTSAFLGLNLYRASGVYGAGASRLFPLLVCAIPLVDAALAVLRRLRSRRSPFDGDRDHFYDLLLARGWSSRRVALTTYGIAAALAIAANIALRMTFSHALLVGGLIWGGLVLAAVRLGSLRGNRSAEAGTKTARITWPRDWFPARRIRQKS